MLGRFNLPASAGENLIHVAVAAKGALCNPFLCFALAEIEHFAQDAINPPKADIPALAAAGICDRTRKLPAAPFERAASLVARAEWGGSRLIRRPSAKRSFARLAGAPTGAGGAVNQPAQQAIAVKAGRQVQQMIRRRRSFAARRMTRRRAVTSALCVLVSGKGLLACMAAKLDNLSALAARCELPPLLHEPPPWVYKVSPQISPLDSRDGVRERSFGNLARLAGLSAPIAKTAPKTVNSAALIQASRPQYLSAAHYVQGAAFSSRCGENQVGAP